MKKRIFILVLIALFPISAGNVESDCTFKGIKLYGKVQIVSSFPDLKVQMVNSFPSSCGKWQSVTSFPDFKIQFVTSFPDVKIKYENSFPGVP